MYQQLEKKNFLEKLNDVLGYLGKKFQTLARRNHECHVEPVERNPNEIYKNFIVPYIKTETALVGYDMFNPNYKLSFLLGFIFADVSVYLIINLIDIWIIWGCNLQTLVFCFVTWMLGWTGWMLIVTALQNIVRYNDLCTLVYEFGDMLNAKTESEEIKKYIEHSKMCKKLILMTTVLCAGGGLICNFYPIVVYFITGNKILPYGFFIPGVSMTENPGYLINYFYQIFQCYCTVLGTMNSTFHPYLFFISSAFFQVDNIIIKLHKLNKRIEAKPHEDGNEDDIRKLVMLHQRFRNFLSTVDEAYNKMFFFNIVNYMLMTICTLFVMVDKMWFVGYYMFLVNFGLILLPCAIGTAIEIKNDILNNEIYDVSWYLLAPKERKIFTFFLFGVHTTDMPSCGGFLPLNINTFRLIYSKVYTLLMFLLDSQKKN
ncbi:putative odorant receptor 83c [Culicoides brevitarsis]|uniref:putative odorant receptor 83c n=1 Tax=Culicoides brevitarsis TaxID=469753 RepID=UPI00307C7BA0